MRVMTTPLEGLLVIEPDVFGDERGCFLEVWRAERYRAIGIDATFVQDNRSVSRRGVVRGLHYQKTHPQGKLVSVTYGSVWDVAVDLRPTSSTFGRWYGVTLDDVTHRQLWIAPGFAHGFAVTSPVAHLFYKCTDVYRPDDEASLRWNDPTLGIDWPIEGDPVLSAKDAVAPFFDPRAFGALP